jgi:hypothetical protein
MDEEMMNMMAMEEMMGGAPMDPGMGAGGDEMVSVMVPGWAVPAVEELIAILSEEGGGMGMDAGMGAEPMPF